MMQERVALAAVPNVAVTVALCFLVAVVEGFDIQALGVAAPKLAPEFLLSQGQLSFIFAASNVGLVLGATGGGWLADRVGRKPVFMGAVLTFGLFTLLTTLSTGFLSLFALRFLAGLGFGAALPNLMAVAAEVSAPERRASTSAIMFCGMPVGGGTSALITQLLPPDFDWRVLFIIGGVFPLLLAPAIHFFMPETLTKRVGIAPRGNFLRALFDEGRTPITLLLWLTFLPTLLILYLILNWLPSLVVANGLDRAVAPQASLAFNWASVVGALVFGKLVDRIDARVPLTFAYVGLIGSLLALSASHDITSTVWLSGAAGFFLLGANYALYGVAATYYPQDVRGTGSGASVGVGRIGAIVGPLLAGMLLSGGTTASGVVRFMVPIAAIAGAAVFALSFYRRPSE
jgi:AAHS family 3-hydroxyphenylpropionic acid transporter